jgi:hypothetical protein
MRKSPSPELDTRKSSQNSLLAPRKSIAIEQTDTNVEIDGNQDRVEKRGQDRTRLIEAMEPPMLKPDYAGIYTTLTGSQATEEKVREGSGQSCCAVYGRKNLRERREPSVDWIG